ncbi:MAG: right-handed parallel beta-helix repeat-containing protein, partial [Thermoplasmata archaeon]|nr:right-handed parallel beta-helix repeat-containing protein [Thermoplasmata archaeon]
MRGLGNGTFLHSDAWALTVGKCPHFNLDNFHIAGDLIGIMVSGSGEVVISNFTMKGSSPLGLLLFEVKDVDSFILKDSVVENSFYGLLAHRISSFLVENCSFSSIGDAAVSFIGNSPSSQYDLTIVESEFADNNKDIFLDSNATLEVIDCVMDRAHVEVCAGTIDFITTMPLSLDEDNALLLDLSPYIDELACSAEVVGEHFECELMEGTNELRLTPTPDWNGRTTLDIYPRYQVPFPPLPIPPKEFDTYSRDGFTEVESTPSSLPAKDTRSDLEDTPFPPEPTPYITLTEHLRTYMTVGPVNDAPRMTTLLTIDMGIAIECTYAMANHFMDVEGDLYTLAVVETADGLLATFEGSDLGITITHETNDPWIMIDATDVLGASSLWQVSISSRIWWEDMA